MAYTIRYQANTKKDLEAAWDTYGSKFQEDMTEWLADIARRAEARDYTLSFDLLELLPDVATSGTASSWRHTFRRLIKETGSQRFWAFLTFLQKRCPPWELRATSKSFFVAGSFHCSIIAFLEIDHVNKLVVFRYFDGLPGQD